MNRTLKRDEQGLYLDYPSLGKLRIDFEQGKLKYRQSRASSRKENLAKAVGIKKGELLNVVDATAGLGRDALILASLGCKVILIERSEFIAALLKDALQRANASEAVSRMQLIQQDSLDYLKSLRTEKPDVIYLDPMFPERKKSAAVKKEMIILQKILGESQGSDNTIELFKQALISAKKRVVIKRPRSSDYLALHRPNFSLIGRTCRFDVYVTTTLT